MKYNNFSMFIFFNLLLSFVGRTSCFISSSEKIRKSMGNCLLTWGNQLLVFPLILRIFMSSVYQGFLVLLERDFEHVFISKSFSQNPQRKTFTEIKFVLRYTVGNPIKFRNIILRFMFYDICRNSTLNRSLIEFIKCRKLYTLKYLQ